MVYLDKSLKQEGIGRRVRTEGGGNNGRWLWAADADWSLELDSESDPTIGGCVAAWEIGCRQDAPNCSAL